MELVTTILRSRKRLSPGHPKPIFIWEPVPDLCTPSELLNLTNALPYVDICSPNAAELASLLGDSELDPETGEVSTSFISTACGQLLGAMPLQSFTLVIRCGAQGWYVPFRFSNPPSSLSNPS
jgi:sugar/nucleoside kinase (ribokinase family)